jgi:hypothetical protein
MLVCKGFLGHFCHLIDGVNKFLHKLGRQYLVFKWKLLNFVKFLVIPELFDSVCFVLFPLVDNRLFVEEVIKDNWFRMQISLPLCLVNLNKDRLCSFFIHK